jgi:hypothetical protein
MRKQDGPLKSAHQNYILPEPKRWTAAPQGTLSKGPIWRRHLVLASKSDIMILSLKRLRTDYSRRDELGQSPDCSGGGRGWEAKYLLRGDCSVPCSDISDNEYLRGDDFVSRLQCRVSRLGRWRGRMGKDKWRENEGGWVFKYRFW